MLVKLSASKYVNIKRISLIKTINKSRMNYKPRRYMVVMDNGDHLECTMVEFRKLVEKIGS